MTRWRWRAATSGATVLALISTVTASVGTPAAAAPALPATTTAATTATPGPTTTSELTLITGDVVTYRFASDGSPVDAEVRAARRADGRPVLFAKVRDGDSYYVYPSDVALLIEAGRLDKRLFDVSYQTRNGYVDEVSESVPLIVQYDRSARTAAATAATVDALPATDDARALPAANGVAVSVAKERAASFWSSVDAAAPSARTLDAGLSKIWLDGRINASLDRSVAQIGAPQAWAAGYTGKDVTVAVLDTGVDATHPDLTDRITGSQSFVEGEEVADGHGHGTHVASTIAGSGAGSGGKYKGVAPDAALLVGKVLNNEGQGAESSAIAGMEWAARQGADVVSMSLSGCCTDGTDPMATAVNELSASYPTLFVIAAANNGGLLTVGTPGVAPSALTVAAVDRQDKRAPFSSRGPVYGGYALKPDIAGPGVDIVAARATGTTMGKPVDDRYTAASGTSMATPHVAGAAAILAQRHPDWTGSQLKAALIGSSKDVGHTAYEVGSGRVDVARAIDQGVTSSGNVDFGTVATPQSGPATRTITYTNATDQDVILGLTASVEAMFGDTPAGALSVPASVTVPAGGSAEVPVTLATGGPKTWYQGSVTATGGDVVVHNVVSAYLQPRRHRLSANVVLPEGVTDVVHAPWYLMRVDDKEDIDLSDNLLVGAGGSTIAGTIDTGTWAVQTAISWRDAKGAPQSMFLTSPEVRIDKDTVVTIDARKGRKVGTRTPKAAVPAGLDFGYTRNSDSGIRGFGMAAQSTYRDEWGLWAVPTAPVDLGGFAWKDQRLLIAPPVDLYAGGTELDARYLSLDTKDVRFSGSRSLPAVFAGHGDPADLAGQQLRGKLVLLDVSDRCPATEWSCTGELADRLTAAHQAGAAAVVVFGGAGRLVSFDDVGQSLVTPVPAMSVPAEQGRALRDRLAKGLRSVLLHGVATTPYVYSLTYPEFGKVPARFDHQVTQRDLYRFDTRLHADAPGEAYLMWQSTAKPGIALGSSQLNVRAPGTLTEFVGPMHKGVQRSRAVIMTYDGPPDMSAAELTGYADGRLDELTRPGQRTDDFGEQPLVQSTLRAVKPADNDYGWRLCSTCRSGNLLVPWHALSRDGLGDGFQTYTTNLLPDGQRTTDVRVWGPDGKEYPVEDGYFQLLFFFIGTPYVRLPDAKGRYRMTENYSTGFRQQRWARNVSSEWTFESETPKDGFLFGKPPGLGVQCASWYYLSQDGLGGNRSPCQPNKQLYLGWDLDLRLDNTLPAGRRQKITVSGYHHSYLSSDPEMTSLKLSVSFDDGRTWERLRTSRSDRSEFTATIDHPRLSRTTGAVSLRAEGVDTAGNTIKQTITRAYGLK